MYIYIYINTAASAHGALFWKITAPRCWAYMDYQEAIYTYTYVNANLEAKSGEALVGCGTRRYHWRPRALTARRDSCCTLGLKLRACKAPEIASEKSPAEMFEIGYMI